MYLVNHKYFLSHDNELQYIYDFITVHLMVTNFFGNPCNVVASPGGVNCNYDLDGKILQKVYWNTAALNPPSTNMCGYIYKIPTKEYLSVGYTLSAYIPKGCDNNFHNCKIHIVVDGGLQTVKDIRMDFVINTGYTFWADTNNIIILYP